MCWSTTPASFAIACSSRLRKTSGTQSCACTSRATSRRRATPESRAVSGRVFEIQGGLIRIAQGWRQGAWVDKGERWEPEQLGGVIRDLISRTPPAQKVYGTGV